MAVFVTAATATVTGVMEVGVVTAAGVIVNVPAGIIVNIEVGATLCRTILAQSEA